MSQSDGVIFNALRDVELNKDISSKMNKILITCLKCGFMEMLLTAPPHPHTHTPSSSVYISPSGQLTSDSNHL